MNETQRNKAWAIFFMVCFVLYVIYINVEDIDLTLDGTTVPLSEVRANQ